MIVGRYAPSPSGRMHLGNARTALLAWLQVRQAGGRLLLRIEDLDRDRCRPEWEAGVREDLAWLGLDFDDEAPRQSTRGPAYEAALARLDEAGLLYGCFCSRAELRAAASAPHGGEARYPGTCSGLAADARAARVAAGRRPALRVRVPAGAVAFDDLVHGTVVSDVAATVGDVLVRRSDGLHAYQLAVVVDDAAQGVTHVLRGDDLLGSTARQIVLARLLGLPVPAYAHVPLVRAADGRRLAKRDADATLEALRAAGRSPAAVVGELAASLGLSEPGAEAMPADLVGALDLAALAAGAPGQDGGAG